MYYVVLARFKDRGWRLSTVSEPAIREGSLYRRAAPYESHLP